MEEHGYAAKRRLSFGVDDGRMSKRLYGSVDIFDRKFRDADHLLRSKRIYIGTSPSGFGYILAVAKRLLF